MKKKVLFVYPDFENLGIAYLLSILKKEGVESDLFFYRSFDPYLKSSFKINYSELAKKIIDRETKIVCFSALTDNYIFQLNLAKEVKKISPKTLIIFGGIHTTLVPEKVISNAFIDAISIGEGEISLNNFINSLEIKEKEIFLPDKPVEGIVFKRDNVLLGEFLEGPLSELDKIPFPNKEPFYKEMPFLKREYLIITSRGCPYYCSYCINDYHKTLKSRLIIRQRSVENVVEELLYAKKKFGIKYVHFADDLFGLNKNWLIDFSRDYKKYIGLPFLCSLSPLNIDEEKIELLKKANCLDIQMGVQSFNEELCKNVLRRPTSNKKIIESIEIVKKHKIFLQTDHLIGIPDDTIENHEKAILTYNEHRPNLISLFFLNYYPKTSITNYALDKGYLKEDDIRIVEEGLHSKKGLHWREFNDENYYGLIFLYNYLFLFPKWLVKKIIKHRYYKVIKIKNYYLTIALPRVFFSIFDRRYFTGRGYILRFFYNILHL